MRKNPFISACAVLAIVVGALACGSPQQNDAGDSSTKSSFERNTRTPQGPDCSAMKPTELCDGPVGESGQCGALTSGWCPNVSAQCDCAEGLYCVAGSCRRPPEGEVGEDGACVPQSACPYDGGFLEPCGEVPAGCGVTIQCGCDWPLECEAGMCQRPNGGGMPCDPHGTQDVCGTFRGEGATCGRQSAGCTGAWVDCGCENGTTCQSGVCRR